MKKTILTLAMLLPIVANATSIETGFTSDDSAAPWVIKVINGANKQILLAAYSFTSKPITAALVAAKKRGVKVYAVLDKSNETEKYSTLHMLRSAAIPVKIDRAHAIQHNKYMIIDGATVETGSFNYTSSAEKRNAENVVVISGDQQVVKRFAQDWNTHWAHAQ